jgi:hypothetical protein
MTTTRTPIKWDKANFAPNTNPYSNQSAYPFTWDDVALLTEVVEIISGGGTEPRLSGQFEYQNLFKDQKKKKQFITLICKIKGYDIYKENKVVNDIKITATDVKLVLKESLGIDVKIEL